MPRRSASVWMRLRPTVTDVGIAAAVAGLVTEWLYRLWPGHGLGLPLDYSGDGLTQASVVKGIIETGWNLSNPRLGAPNGFHAADFPFGGESLHYLAIKFLALLSHNPFAVLNTYFLLSFPMVAVSSVLVLQRLGVRRAVAHPLAQAFAFLPAHLMRGTAHINLGVMYSVPLGCLLVVWVLADEPLLARRADRRWRPVVSGRFMAVLAMAVVIAMAGTYYALFTLVLLTLGGGLGSLTRRQWQPAISAAFGGAAVIAVLALSSLPSVLYVAAHGSNPMAVYRNANQLDTNGLRPVQLVSPVPGHRSTTLANLSADLAEASPSGEATQFLGLLGSAGLVVIAVASVAPALAARKRQRVDPTLGILAGALMVLGATGGFVLLPAVWGFDVIRAWGRVSVVVGFLALIGLGQWLTGITAAWRRATVALLAVGLTAFAVWDQAARSIVATTAGAAAQFHDDERFVRTLEAALPARAMVFELPYTSYPEAPPVHDLAASDLLRPYLHSATLRWSFGGMRGRDTDWMEATVHQPTADLLDSLSAIGYASVVVDTNGFADHGAALLASLDGALGPRLATSGSGRLVGYDLRGWRSQLIDRLGADGVARLAASELDRPTIWTTAGFEFPRRSDEGLTYRMARRGVITIVRRPTSHRRVSMSFTATALNGASGPLVVTVAGKRTEVSGTATLTVELPTEHTDLHLEVTGAPARGPAVDISNVVINAAG